MTKSKNKEVLREIYPDIFVNDMKTGFDFHPTYAIEDGMIQLQSFRGNGDSDGVMSFSVFSDVDEV